jgi:flagellar basal-body rod modification protein FlgD
MATTPVNSSSSGTTSSSTSNSTATNSMQSLTVEDFTKMLVTEMQNQDPTQPMTNTDLMNQVSQIQSIEANQQLTSTLQAVALGQSIASAGNLIGRNVSGLDAKGNKVSGTVSSVSISNGSAMLNIGSSSLSLNEVTQISQASSG